MWTIQRDKPPGIYFCEFYLQEGNQFFTVNIREKSLCAFSGGGRGGGIMYFLTKIVHRRNWLFKA